MAKRQYPPRPAPKGPLGPDFELEITDLARAGAGVGRGEDGRVVFVPLTAPGDRVRVRLVEQDRRYAQGEMLEVLRPSPERVAAPCPVFGTCGGCSWQHLPYARQWATKVSGVLHALKRVGLATEDLKPQEIPATQVWEYRNRIQLRGQGQEIGFFSRRSNQLVPIRRCEIARPELNAQIDRLREAGAKLPKPYKVEVEVLEGGRVIETWNAPHASAGFRQVHDEQNGRLRDWVSWHLTPRRWVLDLYGGSGNLSASLRDRQTGIDCVDTTSPVEKSGTLLAFHRSSVLPWVLRELKKPSRARTGAGSAILDPPREGLGEDGAEIIQAIEQLGVDEVLAVGCDPDSWARDVALFVKRGWRLESLAILDLFPQTPHVESLACLRRARLLTAGQ